MVIDFQNKKGRPFTVFLLSLISLGIFIVSTYLSTLFCVKHFGIILGIILMILAIPCHISGKKFPSGYLLSLLLNSIGNGLSVSAIYIVFKIHVTLFEFIISSVPATGILFLVYLMMQIISKTKKVTITVASVVDIVLLIISAILWATCGATYFAFMFFSLLIALFYICVFGVTIDHEERNVLRDISFGGFGSFVIVTIVVIFVISEGDLMDGFDLRDFINIDGNKKSKGKHHK